MTDRDTETRDAINIGDRVQITVPDPDSQGSARAAGVVIEDYADMTTDSDSAGRDWALVRRWAIALDDGRLTFANDQDIATSESQQTAIGVTRRFRRSRSIE